MNQLTKTLTQIAQKHLHVETLEVRRSDSLDFYDVSVWSIEDALREAYAAGLAAGAKKTAKAKTHAA